jgi:hypothetical protein
MLTPLTSLLVVLPCLLWTQGPESATALKDAGITQICVTASTGADAAATAAADAWRAAGVTIRIIPADDLTSRDALLVPGIAARAGLGSPTRVPWVNANGWQYRRKPAGKFAYDVPPGRGPLAAAEAFAYGGDAVLKIDPADLPEVGRMLAFLSKVPAAPGLTDIADLAVVDDGSPLVGEVMNLLERRNLLFQIVRKPSPRFAINIALGSAKYPQAEAAEPSAFALKIRHQLTDAKRALRIYGSEVVIARLTGNAHRLRLHLLNYSGRELQGLRVRLRGAWKAQHSFIASAAAAATEAAGGTANAGAATQTPPPLSDFVVTHGATEFSVPAMGAYAVIDLTPIAAAPRTSESKEPAHAHH